MIYLYFQVVLSACSTYFDTILSQYEEKDPIVIMRDVKFSDIKVLVEFMYKGEINIDHVSKILFVDFWVTFIFLLKLKITFIIQDALNIFKLFEIDVTHSLCSSSSWKINVILQKLSHNNL